MVGVAEAADAQIEYCEPQPPVFLNLGMSSFVVNWINPTSEDAQCAAGGGEWAVDPAPVEGRNHLLTEKEKMPLMGDLKKGDQLLSLCTSLYNTPLIEHEVPVPLGIHR